MLANALSTVFACVWHGISVRLACVSKSILGSYTKTPHAERSVSIKRTKAPHTGRIRSGAGLLFEVETAGRVDSKWP